MTLLYLFLLFFAWQLYLVSSSPITPSATLCYQNESEEEPPSLETLEVNKTASLNTDPCFTFIQSTLQRHIMGEVIKCQRQEEYGEEVENRKDFPSSKANKTESVQRDPQTLKTTRAQHAELNGCRRVRMYINFTDLGLSDTINSPMGFNGYQCRGKCPRIQIRKFLNRALFMDLMEKKKRIKAESNACCVPTKMSPLSFLYLDSKDDVVYQKFEDMIVNECGCDSKGGKKEALKST